MRAETTVTELLRNFSDYISRVMYRGERFVVTRGGKPVAELSPLPLGTRLGDLPTLLESIPRLEPEDAGSFAEDLAEARRELGARPPGDPWAP